MHSTAERIDSLLERSKAHAALLRRVQGDVEAKEHAARVVVARVTGALQQPPQLGSALAAQRLCMRERTKRSVHQPIIHVTHVIINAHKHSYALRRLLIHSSAYTHSFIHTSTHLCSLAGREGDVDVLQSAQKFRHRDDVHQLLYLAQIEVRAK